MHKAWFVLLFLCNVIKKYHVYDACGPRVRFVAYLWAPSRAIFECGLNLFRRLKHKHAHFTLFMLHFMAYDGSLDKAGREKRTLSWEAALH